MKLWLIRFKAAMEKIISIIIPTYNRSLELSEVIETYFIQKYVREIIVINDGSSESYKNTIDKCLCLQNKYDVKFIYKKNKFNEGAAKSRNFGLKLVSGQYILWGEDDAFLADNYTEVLYKKLKTQKAFCFGSIYYGITIKENLQERNVKIKKQQNNHRKLFNYETLEGYYRLKVEDTEVPWGHALILVPMTAYDNVRYYEKYKINGYREETDAQVQMLENGWKCIYTAETECYHYPTKKGTGQHKKNFIINEIYKTLNNNKFLDRHYNFLSIKFNLGKNISKVKLDFIINQVENIIAKLIGKLYM